MKPATFAQQAAYDACMDIANALKSGRDPTPLEWTAAHDAIALLKQEPQPAGFVESLEMGLAAEQASRREWGKP